MTPAVAVLLASFAVAACAKPAEPELPPAPQLPDLLPMGATPSTAGPSFRLELGQVAEAQWMDARSVAVLSGALRVRAGERYVVLLSAAALEGAPLRYRLSGDLQPHPLALVSSCSRVATEPGPRSATPATASKTAPKLGQRRRFTVRNVDPPVVIQAEVRAVGKYTVVWGDVEAQHPAELEASFVSDFLRDFEGNILERGRTIFGHESDIDGDGRIALLFTPLTHKSAVAYFSSCDLTLSCAGSNRAELLYLTPPNAIRPPYNTPRAIKEILAHELEHLIHHQQKVRSNGLTVDPDSAYMLEGFGALAQDVTGLQAGNLYVTMAGLKGSSVISLADVMTERARYDDERDGPLRGAAYLFVRWLYDRAGGDRVLADGSIEDRGGPSLVRLLLRSPESISATLTKAGEVSQLIADFYTSWTLPAGASQNPCLSFAATTKDSVTGRQRGADPFARFHGMAMRGAATTPFEPKEGSLRAGGAEFFTLDATVDGEQRFGVELPPGATARLRVVRVK
jgi:hypothetical protein